MEPPSQVLHFLRPNALRTTALKTTKRPVASAYTNCETALGIRSPWGLRDIDLAASEKVRVNRKGAWAEERAGQGRQKHIERQRISVEEIEGGRRKPGEGNPETGKDCDGAGQRRQ
jgi:hypothetical protein